VVSLKKRIIIFFLIVGLVPAVLISFYYYLNSISVLKNNLSENRRIALKNIMSRYDKEIDNLIEFTDWIFLDQDINYLLTNNLSEMSDYNEKIVKASDSIANQFSFSQIMTSVSSVFLFGDNGLDLRYSNTGRAYVVKRSELLSKQWVEEGRSKPGTPHWSHPIAPLNVQFEDEYLIPLVRTIIDIDTTKSLGTLVVFINEKLFNEIYSSILFQENELLIFAYSSGVVFSCNDLDLLGENISELDYFQNLELSNSNLYSYKDKKSKYIIAVERSQKYDWQIINIIPLVEIINQQQKILIITISIFFVSLFFTVGLSAFLTRNINRPIAALMEKVKKISQADFSHQRRSTRYDEIGMLEESINHMSVEIQRLMDEKLEREREKHDIELRMLQSQINPHFLYNTLNTVKWLAVLQRAEGISNMLSALSKILKYAVGRMSEKVQLREELEALDDYMKIQKMASKHTIQYKKNISDESLLDCYVMKFILQPIIENSIIHGIKPKSSSGKIELTVDREDHDLHFSIRDDGLGIKKEHLVELNRTADIGNESHIGLLNIKRRIQLLYGQRYGLKVASEFGKYTIVTFSIPMERQPDDRIKE
jgi:two-component system sensor histidine kinase YesM